MTSPASSAARDNEAETVLAEGLAVADRAAVRVGPMLAQLLASDDGALFSDRVLAAVRAQLDDVAERLLNAAAQGAAPSVTAAQALAEALAAHPRLLRHFHALALEAELAERLAAQLGLDPVLSPLLSARLASPDPELSTIAREAIEAQARFVLAQRRGEVVLADLPGDLLRAALEIFDEHCALLGSSQANTVKLPGTAASGDRFGLLERLASGSTAALDLGQAGVALFVTALARDAAIDRDAAILATSQDQAARLALTLRAAGLDAGAIERQLFALHPEHPLPHGIATLDPARAAALLAAPSEPAAR